MCEKRASFELARKPTGSEYKMLTGGIYAMLPLPVEQVQYLYSADAIARAAQSAAESRIRPLRSMNWQKASTPTCFRANRQYLISPLSGSPKESLLCTAQEIADIGTFRRT